MHLFLSVGVRGYCCGCRIFYLGNLITYSKFKLIVFILSLRWNTGAFLSFFWCRANCSDRLALQFIYSFAAFLSISLTVSLYFLLPPYHPPPIICPLLLLLPKMAPLANFSNVLVLHSQQKLLSHLFNHKIFHVC